MMTLASAKAEIARALGLLTHQLQSENLAGQFSLNRITEDILLPILRIILDAPSLHNVNEGAQNVADIDLADSSARVAVQVTVDRSSEKVTTTLTGFLDRGGDADYDRVVMMVVTPTPVRPNKVTKDKWATLCGNRLAFDPARDVITPARLLALISARDQAEVFAIRDLLERSVVGTKHIDVDKSLREQADQQLRAEIRATKYIPDVFVETHDAKYLARCFAHPALFYDRILQTVDRMNLDGFSRRLEEAGLRPLSTRIAVSSDSAASVKRAMSEAAEKVQEINRFKRELSAYAKLSKDPDPRLLIKPELSHIYESRYFLLEQSAQYLPYTLDDRLKELSASTARIFVMTGKAGQGKTNFVCDFLERFLWAHEIPSAFVSARRLSAMSGADLADTVQRMLFGGKTSTFDEAAERLSEAANRRGTPFVLIIDGLNEHHRPDFATQLEQFFEVMLRYPALRVMVTCRSEFFEARFGAIFRGDIRDASVFVENTNHRDRAKQQAALVRGYFAFFQVDEARVATKVVELLVRDMLLLRFFCEAYGARDKDANYRQPYIGHIYRDQIFDIYLRKKLIAGGGALREKRGEAIALEPERDLRDVLRVLLKYMVDEWRFADIPRSVVPGSMDAALLVLLEEDLILRADIEALSALGAPRDTLNFTFDELRDYALAEYLVSEVFKSDRTRFSELLERGAPEETQSMEGLRRFLFYASRRPEHSVFGEFYRTHPWYLAVYDEEIFNVDPAALTEDDAELVRRALDEGGERAIGLARRLALHWSSMSHPRLNLDLLLAFLHDAEQARYHEIVMGVFARRYYGDANLTQQFCDFVREHILSPRDHDRIEDTRAIYRLLALLLPVDTDHNLNSESGRTLAALAEIDREKVVAALKWSLGLRTSEHRAHVWRLLSYLADSLRADEALASLALADTQSPADPVRREAKRYLDLVGAAAMPVGESQ